MDFEKERGELTNLGHLRGLNLFSLAYHRGARDLIFYYQCRYDRIDLNVDSFTSVYSYNSLSGMSSLLKTLSCKALYRILL